MPISTAFLRSCHAFCLKHKVLRALTDLKIHMGWAKIEHLESRSVLYLEDMSAHSVCLPLQTVIITSFETKITGRMALQKSNHLKFWAWHIQFSCYCITAIDCLIMAPYLWGFLLNKAREILTKNAIITKFVITSIISDYKYSLHFMDCWDRNRLIPLFKRPLFFSAGPWLGNTSISVNPGRPIRYGH